MNLNIRDIEFKRKSLQISQDDFSEKIGITRFTYKKLLDNQDFRLQQLIKMSEILQIPFCELFIKIAENGNIKVENNNLGNGNTTNIKNGVFNNDNQILKQEIEYLKRENELLKQMNELLKNK